MLHESVEVSLDSLDSPDSLDIKQAWNAWRKSGKLRTTTTPPWNEPAIGNSKALKMDKVTQGDILQLRISSDNREPGAPRRVVDILTTVEYWGWEEETSEEGDNSWSLVIKCSRRRPLEAAAKVLVMGAEGARQAGPTGNKGRNKSSLEEYYLMADGVNIGHGNYRIQWTPWPKAPAMGDFTETWHSDNTNPGHAADKTGMWTVDRSQNITRKAEIAGTLLAGRKLPADLFVKNTIAVPQGYEVGMFDGPIGPLIDPESVMKKYNPETKKHDEPVSDDYDLIGVAHGEDHAWVVINVRRTGETYYRMAKSPHTAVWWPPPPGTLVLVLDEGSLDTPPSSTVAHPVIELARSVLRGVGA
jgi:hypothetical protein